MSGQRPPFGWASGLSLMGAAAIGFASPAFADRAVQMSFSESPGYARITAKWADGDAVAPRVSARVSARGDAWKNTGKTARGEIGYGSRLMIRAPRGGGRRELATGRAS